MPDGALSTGGGGGLEDALAVLRAAYAADLPDLVRALEALLDEAAARPEATARARQAAHRIRGTAGSYGFAAVGEIAGGIEDALDEGRPVPPDLRRALVALASEPR